MRNTQYLISQSDDTFVNQALEKYLLEYVPPQTVILYLWQNAHTVVIGKNQNAWQECQVASLEREGGKLARRISGGGAVYHDLGNLNFTFIAEREDYSVPRQLAVIKAALAELGVDAQVSGRNDITVSGRKVSGNAFYEGRSCFHHGTLLLSVDKQLMTRYLQPAGEKLRSKGVSSVRSRVANLNEFCPGLSPDIMAEALLKSFSTQYRTMPLQLEARSFDQERLEQLRHEFADPAWRLNRPIPCDAEFSGRFSWGGLTVRLAVSSGVVRQAEVYTDSLDPTLAHKLAECWQGRPFSSAILARAVQQHPVLRQQTAEDVASLLIKQDF